MKNKIEHWVPNIAEISFYFKGQSPKWPMTLSNFTQRRSLDHPHCMSSHIINY